MGYNPNAMQAKGFVNWPNATDAYGFSALPAGCYNNISGSDLGFDDVGSHAYFWSSSEDDNNLALRPDGFYYKSSGLSVRCVQD